MNWGEKLALIVLLVLSEAVRVNLSLVRCNAKMR